MINQDQKINYLLLRDGKHRKTDTLNQNATTPTLKVNIHNLPFKTSYNAGSESKFIWSDKPAPKETNYNNRSTTYDPTNTQRALGGHKKLDFNDPKLFTKVNGISEFNQITHAFNSNHNKDYINALEQKKHFRKAKGMCSEYAKLAKYQPK